ncbi:MAG TPA: hypothetical protein VGX25_15510 [Actinophytocola sp.]|nr:hypothetical protein [Actinophytocola sp.]HEV2780793.1 hypothetical protein [Actinophytocola sp.]
MDVVHQAEGGCSARVGTFKRSKCDPDKADTERVFGDDLRLRDAKQEPSRARKVLQVA